MAEATIMIDGMSCMHCVTRVKKSIENLAGVNNLNVEVGRRPSRLTMQKLLRRTSRRQSSRQATR